MKNHRHQVISLFAAAREEVVHHQAGERPGLEQLAQLEEREERHQPDGGRPRASRLEPHGVGDSAGDRHAEGDPGGPARQAGGHQDAGEARTRLWGMKRGGRRWSDSSTSRNMRPERDTATPTARSVKIMSQAGAAKPPRMSDGRHQAGQHEGQRQEQHDDVVGEDVGHQQRHGRDDGPERDEPGRARARPAGEDPSQAEDHERREGAQRAHGGEPAGEPPDERRSALAAAGRRRLRGGRASAR